MFLRTERLEYLEAYKLRLTFSDRVTQEIDLAEELYGEIFEPLKARNFDLRTPNFDLRTRNFELRTRNTEVRTPLASLLVGNAEIRSAITQTCHKNHLRKAPFSSTVISQYKKSTKKRSATKASPEAVSPATGD